MDIEALAAPGLHEKIIELVERLPGTEILDAPTGKGALAYKLLSAGKHVTAGDIDIAKFGLPADTPNLNHLYLDLNDAVLPIEDNRFDVAISAEGIEHLQHPWNLLGNLHRVLKPGGYLILTTPNILNFASRFRYVMEGRYEHFKRPMVKNSSWTHDLENYHISPISYFELQFMLESSGFEISAVHTNRYKSRNLFSVCLKPFFEMIYKNKDKRDNKRHRGDHGALYRTIMSDEVYYGECLVVLARKAGNVP